MRYLMEETIIIIFCYVVGGKRIILLLPVKSLVKRDLVMPVASHLSGGWDELLCDLNEGDSWEGNRACHAIHTKVPPPSAAARDPGGGVNGAVLTKNCYSYLC